MTTENLAKALSFTVYSEQTPREISCGYCGDLLSFVMAKAPEGSAWITVMGNNNAAAVALLCDVACIILAEGVAPDEQLLSRAKKENLNLYGSPLDAFTLACKIDALIKQ